MIHMTRFFSAALDLDSSSSTVIPLLESPGPYESGSAEAIRSSGCARAKARTPRVR